MTGLHFWAPGYCVSTVGLNEEQIRKYIREQEQLENGQGFFELARAQSPNGAFPM